MASTILRTLALMELTFVGVLIEVGLNSFENLDGADEPSDFVKLFAEAKEGSREQQAELLDSFRNFLRVLAKKSVGDNLNAQMSVSDLVQSAIIDACNGFDQCQATGKEEFKGWLRQILINDILNRYRYLRRQKRDIGKETELDTEVLVAPGSNSPAAEAQRKEDEQRLAEAIEKLLPDHQSVIQLRHRDKLSFREIGEQMDRTTDAARMLWNRAVEELSKKL